MPVILWILSTQYLLEACWVILAILAMYS